METIRVVLFLFTTILSAAFSHELPDRFSSEKIQLIDERFDGYRGRVNKGALNVTPMIINGFFDVPLNHFEPSDSRQLRLNFQSIVEYFEEDGPIFININDLAGTKWIESGLVHDVARELGGALVTSDYRFNGRNAPENVTVRDLQFSTIDHLLGDVAHLITIVRQNFDSPKSQVILFGSRLGGTISALARKKFPHLVNGAWSSGGIFRAIVPQTSYFNSMSSNIYRHGSAQCARTLNGILQNITQLVESGNRTRLVSLFNLCETNDFSHPLDATTFYERIFYLITIYIDTRHYVGIRDLCNDINRIPDPLTAFARWVNYVYDTNGQCRDFSHRFEMSRRNSSYIYRAYSFCTQLGINLFVTTENGTGGVFPNVMNETFNEIRCSELFGRLFNRTLLDRAVENFNTQHGSQDQVVTNAIFSFGELDPFLDHGITEYNVESSEVAGTPLHSVEADMASLSDFDSADLQNTKHQILAALRRFAERVEHVDPNGNNRISNVNRNVI